MIRTLGLALALIGAPALAEPCRLALALALDVSGSVDTAEYRLQMDGLADALTDPDVRAALLDMPGAPVAVAVYAWSGSGYQRLVQDWVTIVDDAALAALAARLRATTRQPAPQATGLGRALVYGRDLIDQGPACWDRTLDVSGDGRNNDWPTPQSLRATGRLGDLRINALVILTPEAGDDDLAAYFRARVIQGPDAFVEEAQGFEDYSRAMRRKLLKELATRPVGALDPRDGREEISRRF